MVSMTDLSAQHGSAAASRRLKARRAADFRLKLYGIIAIALAGLALIALLGSTVMKASLAVTEHYLTPTLSLPAEDLGATPEDLARANYDGLVKAQLRAMFPSMSDRRSRRELYGIVSSGASFELRDHVLANPDAVGGAVDFPLLASDDVDLYLKGDFGDLRKVRHSGDLSPTGTEGTIELLSTSNDFVDQLLAVKATLLDAAALLRRQADRQEAGRAFRAAEAAEAADDAAREGFLAQAEAFAAERDRLNAEADDLEMRAARPGGQEALDNSTPSVMVRINGGVVKATELSATGLVGETLIPLDSDAAASPEDWVLWVMDTPERARKISDKQIVAVEILREQGAVSSRFNTRFFTAGDSREPELAGIWGAAVGSFWTMLVTFCLAFPIGVLAAIYLEEFAPKNRLTDFIEVNINNLAAVPSIVFGLLGLSIFVAGISVFGIEIGGFMPRSAPVAGGAVLALMTLPTIIIASRASIRAVPPSIRDAALGLGASKLQTSFHHVLPLAMPGILTGTIIGMAQALGETAPLIMIGMVAFIVDIPGGITDSATVLPVQVFRWSDFPERGFEARTAAAICVLLVFLVFMNALAVFLRRRFERRW
ncbi:MAG: phosphate ABC transporter permease PstA [Pseudomonadota bacterium]